PLTVSSELIPRFMLSLMHPVIRMTSTTNAPIRPAVRARRDILGPPVVGIPGDYSGRTGGARNLRGERVHHVLLEIGQVSVQLVGALGLGIAGEVRGRRL